MINVLMNFNKDAALVRTYFDWLIDDINRGSYRDHGIEKENIFRIEPYTSVSHKTSNSPREIRAMDTITVDGQT